MPHRARVPVGLGDMIVNKKNSNTISVISVATPTTSRLIISLELLLVLSWHGIGGTCGRVRGDFGSSSFGSRFGSRFVRHRRGTSATRLIPYTDQMCAPVWVNGDHS